MNDSPTTLLSPGILFYNVFRYIQEGIYIY